MKVGVLGGGQLGRMLALAGYPLGLHFRFLDPASDSPSEQLAELIHGSFMDNAALDRFAENIEIITYEFENVPIESARLLEKQHKFFPPPAALEISQDRISEKDCFRRLGIPTPEYLAVNDEAGLHAAVQKIGLPAVLKTRRLGYDGKGQFVLKTPQDVPLAWKTIGGVPLILEAFMRFERELSIIAVRGVGGDVAFYPLIENQHRDGILRLSLVPARGQRPDLQAQAESHAKRIMDSVGYAGVFTLELFEVNGELYANEMAPRVHNSGHWTIEGAETSQFENHLRAIIGLPLGSTELLSHAAMVNLIGDLPDAASVLRVPGAHLHFYGKEPRPKRKVGHITLLAHDAATLKARLDKLRFCMPADVTY